MELLEIMKNRRSIRSFTDEPVPCDKLDQILEAGLLSPSGKAIRPWELIVVKDKAMLSELVNFRAGGASALKKATCAVVVIADTEAQDVWTEDCSIVMYGMQLMASSLNVGSCWVQGRLRSAGSESSDAFVRARLGYPAKYQLQAILALGIPAEEHPAYDLNSLHKEKIHHEKF